MPELLSCTQFVNSDEVAKSLAPFNPEKAQVSASRYMLLKTRYLFQRHEDFCIETTLATRSLLKTIQTARADGYSVTVLYFWLDSPDRAVDRVRARVEAGGHNIAEEIILQNIWRPVGFILQARTMVMPLNVRAFLNMRR